MPVRLFVNELSFPDQDCALAVAKARLDALVGAFRAVNEIDRGMLIDSAVALSQLNIATNWPIAQLRNQSSCKEPGLFLRRLQDRAPFAHAMGEAPDDEAGGAEYRVPDPAPVRAGAVAVGLGLAHVFDGIGVSLATDVGWERPYIPLDRHHLDGVGEIVTTQVEARNAMNAAAVTQHADYLSELVHPVVQDGAEIWDRRSDLFPHLRFIARTKGQLVELQHGDPLVAVVLEKLLKLDEAIRLWRETGAQSPPYPYFIRPESQTREKYAWFSDDAGTQRLFSLHGDYAPGENRFHFILEDQPTRSALVGHLGRKLGI